jgi:hypothetical protein
MGVGRTVQADWFLDVPEARCRQGFAPTAVASYTRAACLSLLGRTPP